MKNKKDITAAREVNEHIRAALDNWADIILDMDAHHMSYYMDYFPADIANVAIMFTHVVTNVGIKNGRINDDNAVEYGKRIRQIILDYTGFDSQNGHSVDNEHNPDMN